MARPLRIAFPGAFYHVTSRGNERNFVFKSNQDRIKFLGYLGSASQRYDALIHAYCLMDNHYHLLLETPSGNLAQIMHHINGAYTTYVNVKHDRTGHLFQGRYKSILIDEDEYAKELSRYIHLNPVRANIVENPADYEWSSYNQYAGRKKPEEWLVREFILSYFGKNTATAEKTYEDFVNRLVGQEYANPLKETVGSALLGGQDFINMIKNQYLAGAEPSKEIPAVRAFISKISMQKISDVVEKYFNGDKKTARNIKIFLCHKHTGEKLKTIGMRFGIGDTAVSQVCKRFKVMISRDKRLNKKIDLLEKKINM